MSPPLREARESCWIARDKYWECLQENEEKRESCLQTREVFEKFCSKMWVKHFDKKREYEKFKAQMKLNDPV